MSLKGRTLSAEHRARISAGRKGQCTPAQREALARVRASRTAEQVAKATDALRRWNESPEGQAQMRANLEWIQANWARSPENLAHLATVHESWARSPEGVAQAAANYPGFAGHGKALRERDGDLCQLCLEPIDFTLGGRLPMSVSVDHIVPRRAGGTDDLANLWLAHLICNMKKGALHCGRADGSTDPR